MPTISYHTLGCKVNQYETAAIRRVLESAGFLTVAFGQPSDACVINTCSVTGIADSKSRAAVRRARRANPDAFVIVTGCYAQLEPDEATRNAEGCIVVPNDEKDTIPDLITARLAPSTSTERRSSNSPSPCRGGLGRGHSAVATAPTPRTRTRAVVKVQDGCDNFCSYCIIPFARPVMTSRPLPDVLQELSYLAEIGYREIVLTGIRLGSYRSGDVGLAGLVREVCEIDGIKRVRLSSIEPWEVDEPLLEAMCHPKVCRHLHIPLQSADDRVLSAMNRPYGRAEYLRVLDSVRAWVPDIGITTDIIVGFPGEDDEAFENTLRAVDQAGFSRVHVFRFSARKRTRAASMPGHVPEPVKKRRATVLSQAALASQVRFAESFVGKVLPVLVERRRSDSGKLTGYTDNYIEAIFDGPSTLVGAVVNVRITRVTADGEAEGEVV